MKEKINVSNAVNDYYKIQIFSGDSEKAKTPWLNSDRRFRGWMEPSFSTHQTTKYGWEITNHALRRNVTLSILKNISKRTFDTTNKVIVHFNML
jgi:hypothetical protein